MNEVKEFYVIKRDEEPMYWNNIGRGWGGIPTLYSFSEADYFGRRVSSKARIIKVVVREVGE